MTSRDPSTQKIIPFLTLSFLSNVSARIYSQGATLTYSTANHQRALVASPPPPLLLVDLVSRNSLLQITVYVMAVSRVFYLFELAATINSQHQIIMAVWRASKTGCQTALIICKAVLWNRNRRNRKVLTQQKPELSDFSTFMKSFRVS